MVKRMPAVLFFSLILAACGQLAPTASPAATARPTLTVTTTVTAAPTLMPTPSATIFPTLSGEKPYLVVSSYRESGLFVYDRSGQGRKILSLPEKIRTDYYSPFSADGKWFAFYTGEFGRGDAKGDLPVTLNILNTEDGTIRKVADVVTDDSVKKLPEWVVELKASDPEHYKPIDDWDWAESRIMGAFAERLYSFAWSPDSRALAFAAQIDGLSSDVYLYDVAASTVQRLNDDLESVWSIFWSPDGKKILFQNAYPGNTYVSSGLHIVEPGAKTVKNPKSVYDSWFFGGGIWLTPNLLLVAQGTDTGGSSRVQTLNVSTGQLSDYIWEDNYADFVVDPENRTILINTHELIDDAKKYGIYLLSPGKSRTKVFDGLYWLTDMIFRGGAKHRFLVRAYSHEDAQYKVTGELIGITSDNKPTILGKFKFNHIYISPDYAWMMIYDEKDREHLYLYDKNDELVKTFQVAGIREILWRPDSQSIAYVADQKLYFLSIPDGEPKFVDDCGGECFLDLEKAVWLP